MWWLPLVAAAEPSAVDSVKARWKQVHGIKNAGELYAFQIDANPQKRDWAAFGEFSDVTTCYRFTRGESPYPEPEPILVELKKSVSTHDASRSFLFTDRGELIFAHASRSDGPDWRVSWTDEQVLKIRRGDTKLPVETPPPAVAALWASGTAAFRLCVYATRADGVWTEL